MNYVIVDLEMNPIADKYKEEQKICRLEVIEIGAVIMDDKLSTLGEFKTLVKPQYNKNIRRKYKELTGISTMMVADAPNFARAYDSFTAWCESYGEEYEVYAWSDSDYNQIVAEMRLKNYSVSEKQQKVLNTWHDFQKEFMRQTGIEKTISLEKALNSLGIMFEGKQHDALWDAKNTAELFVVAHDKQRCSELMKKVVEALKPKKMTSTLGELFNFKELMGQ